MIKTPDWLQTLIRILIQDQEMAFLGLAFLLKCLLISLYCLLIYWAIRIVKHIWGKKISVRANYYSWYALLLSFPLSGLGTNTGVKLSFYDLFLGSFYFMEFDLEDISAINRFNIIAKSL